MFPHENYSKYFDDFTFWLYGERSLPFGGTFGPLFDSMCAEVGCSWLDDGGCSDFVALQTEVQKVANVKDEFVILKGKTVNKHSKSQKETFKLL